LPAQPRPARPQHPRLGVGSFGKVVVAILQVLDAHIRSVVPLLGLHHGVAVDRRHDISRSILSKLRLLVGQPELRAGRHLQRVKADVQAGVMD
jgi:hypothetical protein